MAPSAGAIFIGAGVSLLALMEVRFSPMKLSGSQAAIALFSDQVLLFLILCCLVLALTGTFLGRPILRLLASFVLPPRQRIALAPLWTCDGKKPPSRKPWDRR